MYQIPHSILSVDSTLNGCRVSTSRIRVSTEAFHSGMRPWASGSELSALCRVADVGLEAAANYATICLSVHLSASVCVYEPIHIHIYSYLSHSVRLFLPAFIGMFLLTH